ncbi:MAG: VanZ family protein [Acidobacteria bacterium]|nr:VanZ family protein [Acidobacteriota bacterium]
MTERVFRFLLVLSASVLLYGSLYPLEFRETPWPHLIYRPATVRALQLDAILNVLVYIPLGAFAAAGFRTWRARGLAWIALCAMSLGIEYTQLWIRTRTGDLRDFYCNSFGALLGLLGGVWLARRLRLERLAKLWRRDPGAWLLLIFWMLWQLFPFVPLARFAKLHELIALWSAPSLSFLQIGDALCSGLALGLLTKSAGAPWALPCVAATLLLRGFIIGNTLPLTVFIPAVVVFAICRRMRVPIGLAASLTVTWLLLRELYPFAFSRHAASFHWGTFHSLLEAERVAAARTLLGKLFLYGASLWMLLAAGWRLSLAAPLLALLLLGCEWLQRYLPGRTPELTDPVLVLLMAAILAMAHKFRH